MQPRSIVILLLVSLLLAAPAARSQEVPPSEDLAALVAAALTGNPELKASASRWEGERSRAKGAGALDDPMLMLKVQNGIVSDPLNFSRDAMTQKVIGISQLFPYYGKRALREEVATREAESYQFGHEERRLEIARQVKQAYYQIYLADRWLTLVVKNIEVMDTFITLAQTKYAVGQGAQQDIFKAQLERSRLLDMQITLEQQRQSAVIALNSLVYRPVSTQIGAIPEVGLGSPLPSASELVTIAIMNRPELRRLRALQQKGEGGYALAKKEFFPDFNVSFEYMQRQRAMGSDGADMYSLGVTFNLPVRKDKREAMLAESASEITMAGEELNAARNSIASGVSELQVQMERRRRQVDLYKTGIIPQAEQSLESATIGYRVNKVDFLTLLDSRVSLFNYQREYYDALADYQTKRAQLEALIGRSLD